VSDQNAGQDDDGGQEMIVAYRSRWQALQLCIAMSAGDAAAVQAICVDEVALGLGAELAAGAANIAVALAREVAATDPEWDLPEAEALVWKRIAEAAMTGLQGSIEIAEMTNPSTTDEEN